MLTFERVSVPAVGYMNDITFFESLTVTIGANVALYSDNGSGTAPQAWLAEGTAQPVNYGWSDFLIPQTLVAPGYWLAMQTNVTGAIQSSPSGGTSYSLPHAYTASFAGVNPVSGGSAISKDFSVYADICAPPSTSTPTFTASPTFTVSPTSTFTITNTTTDSPTSTFTRPRRPSRCRRRRRSPSPTPTT